MPKTVSERRAVWRPFFKHGWTVLWPVSEEVRVGDVVEVEVGGRLKREKVYAIAEFEGKRGPYRELIVRECKDEDEGEAEGDGAS